jgi:molybdate transport system substrate-binding protein
MVDSVILMSGFAVQGALEPNIIPDFEREADIKIDARWTPTTLVMQALGEGTEADVLILAESAINELVEKGLVDPDSRTPLADAKVGLAVLAGKPKPDISTTEAFRQAVLSCSAIAYSRAGQSGIYFEMLIDQLGVGEEVRKKAVVIPQGLTAEKLVSGEADLAIQQISELSMVKGADVIGPLPEEISSVTGFTAAILRSSKRPEQAKKFVAALASSAAMKAYADAGLSPRQ